MCVQNIAINKLREHSHEFRKEVIRVTSGVYVAVGYAASNVSMLVGDDGLIIIDTTESTAAAENILAEFRKITDLPVKTIIYTHSHRDHISGAQVFVDAGDKPEIISRDNLLLDLNATDDEVPSPKQIMVQRARRQFGFGLEDGTERINLGLGPGDRPVKGLGAGFVKPTRMISEQQVTLSSCGFELELQAAPGETADHMVIWWGAQRVLFSGDNFYKSFPNLYAIRGTPYRDFAVWGNTMHRLATFDAEHLVPGHSRPLQGTETIRQQLKDYGSAILSIIEQTAAAMNRGETPDEIVGHVKLPAELAERPYLQEFYGTVAWSARAYFAGTVGWFDGNPTNLFPTPPNTKAAKMAKLAGGEEQLYNNLLNAQTEGDHQWACELADILLALDYQATQVKNLKADSLGVLADQQINATARNYYLVYAKELRHEAEA